MNITLSKYILQAATKEYSFVADAQLDKFFISRNKELIFSGSISSKINSPYETDETQSVVMGQTEQKETFTSACFIVESTLWGKKEAIFDLFDDHIEYRLQIEGENVRLQEVCYFKSGSLNQTACTHFYAPRFDWSCGKVIKGIDEHDILSCQQWLSPPPFCFVFKNDKESFPFGIMAEKGQNNFISYEYLGKSDKMFRLNYEGHTVVDSVFTSPVMYFGKACNEDNEAISDYIRQLSKLQCIPEIKDKEIPRWWYEPIFCGWGAMRYDYRSDHDGHENGNFINVTDYCTQTRYNHYMKTLENNGVNPGTVIIDMGWAQNAALADPDKNKWYDMRGFIDEQHQKGRRVLLWYTPVITEGLPNDACMILQARPVAPDPTNPFYVEILNRQIYKMLSSDVGCLDADGFKIDFTQNTPSEDGIFRCYLNSFWGLINETNDKHLYDKSQSRNEYIKTHSAKWGVEILRKYIENIYITMKQVKADSMLITHTANPYFNDIVDVLRLNDIDGESDNVLEIMRNRYFIASMSCDKWLIDTDNDLMINKQRWRDYTKLQPSLGIPDTYYCEYIATSGEKFDEKDYQLLRDVWRKYRNTRLYT